MTSPPPTRDFYRRRGLGLANPLSNTTNSLYGSFYQNHQHTCLQKIQPYLKNREMDELHKKVSTTYDELGQHCRDYSSPVYPYLQGRRPSNHPTPRDSESNSRRSSQHTTPRKENQNPKDARREWYLPPIERISLPQSISEIMENQSYDSTRIKLPNIESIDIQFADNTKAKFHIRDIDLYRD